MSKKFTSFVCIILICSFLLSAMAPVIPEITPEQQTEEISEQNNMEGYGGGENQPTPEPTPENTYVPGNDNTLPDVVIPEQPLEENKGDGSQDIKDDNQQPEITPEGNKEEIQENNEEIKPTEVAPEHLQEENNSGTEKIQEDLENPEQNSDLNPEENLQVIPVLNVTEFVHLNNTPEFRIIVTNMGNTELKNISVKTGKPNYTLNGSSEPIPASGSYTSINSVPAEIEGDTYQIGDMEPGKIIELTYRVDIPEGFSSAVVNSSVEVTGYYTKMSEEGEVDEKLTGSSSASVYILGENPYYADLGVSLVDSKEGYYFPGESILHQVVVSNNSEFDMENVTVSYNGLSAPGYEDIPCVFTRICSSDGCYAISSEKQDSVYTLEKLMSAGKNNHSVVMFCENGVNNAYSENVTYSGSAVITANVLPNDIHAPANSTVEVRTDNVMVEVMVPMTLLSAAPQLSSAPEEETDKLLEPEELIPAPMLMKKGPALRSASTLILRADCVNARCIGNTETTKSFYVSLCNDGEDSYNNINLSSNQPGSFNRYFHINLNEYNPNGGYTEKDPVAASGTSINTGPLAGKKCVVGVFDAVIQNPPKDHTEFKTFSFGVNADGQTGTVNVSVDGCYVPVVNPGLDISVNPITQCVSKNASSNTYNLKIENTGNSELCGIVVTANRPGYFTYRNTNTPGPSYSHGSELYDDDFFSLKFTENLEGADLGEGTRHNAVFNVTGYLCSSTSTKLEATGEGSFEVCVEPKPSISITPTPKTECIDVNAQDTANFTIKNDGQVDFCRLDLEYRIVKNGSVVGTKTQTVNGLAKNVTANMSFSFTPSQFGINEGDSFEVHMITNAYTSNNGSCTVRTFSNIDRKVDETVCRSSLIVTPKVVTECNDVNPPRELTFTLKNDGQVDFCKIEGEFQVKKGGNIVGRQAVRIDAGLKKGVSTDAKYTLNAASLGLKEGDNYEVHLVVDGYTSANGACTAKPQSGIDKKIDLTNCKTGLTVTPEIVAECNDANSPRNLTFSLKNDGELDFCKIEGEFQVKKGGNIVGRQAVRIDAGLKKGATTEAKYTLNAASLGLKEGDSYEVHLVADGYTSANGACTAKPQSGIDKKIDLTNCTTVLTVTPEIITECNDANSPRNLTFTLKNDGQVDFCKIEGEFQVKKGGNIVGRQAVRIDAGLKKGATTDAKYTLNAASLGLKEGDSYEVHLVVDGYTSANGACTAKPQSGIDKKIDLTNCKTGLTVTPPVKGECIDHETSENYLFVVENTGEQDMCKIDGEFHLIKNGVTIRQQNVSVNSGLKAGKTVTLDYTVDPQAAELSGGDEFIVKLIVNGYTGNENTCETKVQSGITAETEGEVCIVPIPSIVVTPPEETECHDMDEPEEVEFTVKNDGEVAFCRLEGEFQVIKEGETIGTQKVTITEVLNVGETTTVKYTVNAKELGLEGGDTYTVKLIIDGYTEKNGACTEKPLDPVEAEVEKDLCEPLIPSLVITPPEETECHDMDEPEDVEFTVKNDGEVAFCRLEGEFQVIKEGETIGTQKVTITEVLNVGETTTVKYTVNAKELGLEGGDTYTVKLVLDGYTEKDGSCTEKPLDPVEAEVEKDLCEPLIPSLVITPPEETECHDMDEPEEVEFTVKNDGEVAFCRLEGEFQVIKDGETIGTQKVTITEVLNVGDTTTVKYTVDAKELGLEGGDTYTVKLIIDGYTEKNGACTEKPLDPVEAEVEKDLCEPLIPSLVITPPEETECHDMDEPEEVEFTVKNDGEVAFCRLEGEFQVIKEGETIGTQKVTITEVLNVGDTTTVKYTVDAKELGLESGDTYTVKLILDGYTEKNGECTEKPLDPVEAEVEKDLCEPEEPSLVITPPDPDECHDMDEPEEVEFTIKNDGEVAFCRLDGEFQVIKGGETIATQAVTITEVLNVGDTTTVKYIVDPEKLGLNSGDTYTVKLLINGYIEKDGECSEEPDVIVESEVSKKLCEIGTPSLIIESEPQEECQSMQEPEETVFKVTNDGELDFCLIDGTFQVYLGRKIIKTETVVIDGLKVGESTDVVFTADPDELGLDAGETYRVKLTLRGHVADGDDCREETIDPVEHIAERTLCEDVKPVVNVINLNPECIDAGDTLKFKGEINIDENTAARTIELTTGNISWGGADYACRITSVKENSEEGYRVLEESEQGTTWVYEVTERGEGVLGFICEAKTNPKEFMRNGKQLKFDSTAVVSTVRKEYTIRSNRIVDTQKCPVVKSVKLPGTGDDTNLPLLIALVSGFTVMLAGTAFVIHRKKKTKKQD